MKNKKMKNKTLSEKIIRREEEKFINEILEEIEKWKITKIENEFSKGFHKALIIIKEIIKEKAGEFK